VPTPLDLISPNESNSTPAGIHHDTDFADTHGGKIVATEVPGAWVCYPCESVLDMLSIGDKRDRDFETVCPECGRQGTFRPRPTISLEVEKPA
jgi:hypothetical protein